MKNLRGKAGKAARDRRGHAVLEGALLAPWMMFLFVGAFDVGFYNYAVICTENAARVAALYTSSGASVDADSYGACQYALAELNSMSNVRGLTPPCTSLPVIVTASQVTGIDGALATQVSVTYQTNQLIPLPWLTGRLTITRTAQMRVNS